MAPRYRGRRAGQFGPAMFSLYATKNLMTGEGGFATTDDDELADRIRLFRNHGMRVRYHHDVLGTNFKPTDLAAAIGLAQLATARRAHRRAPAQRGFLRRRPRAATSRRRRPTGREHVWHQYMMRFPGERTQSIDGLAERGVGHAHLLPGPDPPPAVPPGIVPGAADLPFRSPTASRTRSSSIPVHPSLTDEELATVIARSARSRRSHDRRASPR